LALLASTVLWAAVPARADDTVPYWASLHAPEGKAAGNPPEVNVRVGPGLDYRIGWVYHRQHLPVKVLREMDGWRLVEDQDHARGWVLVHFVSRTRTAAIIGDVAAESHAAPDPASHLNWRFLPGVIGILGDCNDGWCKLDVDGRVGFVEQGRLWGASPP
jgi:SH3-like domain-containing protein